MMAIEWRAYYPDDGETIDDARNVSPNKKVRVLDAEHAAELACEYDYGERDGWERIDTDFAIVIVAPDGEESRWIGKHEPSIEHRVDAAEDIA